MWGDRNLKFIKWQLMLIHLIVLEKNLFMHTMIILPVKKFAKTTTEIEKIKIPAVKDRHWKTLISKGIQELKRL